MSLRALFEKLTGHRARKAREVDEDILRKRETFRRELDRLEVLAIEAKIKGRDWNDKRDSDSKSA
jgi:hypothetical protein